MHIRKASRLIIFYSKSTADHRSPTPRAGHCLSRSGGFGHQSSGSVGLSRDQNRARATRRSIGWSLAVIDQFNPAICGVCARSAIGIGYAPKNVSKVLWTCADPKCIQAAKAVHAMKQDQFSRIESMAAAKGGDAGIEFLETIGKTDFTTLTIDEWSEFRRRIIGGYRAALVNDMTGKVTL